jgi:cytidine deaminase
MIEDDDLYQRAKETLNPRKLSPLAEAGGVASALVTDQGNVYVGVCVDTNCGMGFCAEHTAIANMVTNGESRILTIVAVNWDGRILSPCGRCREFIYQVDSANVSTRVLLHGDRESTIEQLLPDHWAAATS